MSLWVLSDDQLIERIRRWQRYRRPVGALCALLGIVGVVLLLYWMNDLRSKSLALADEMRNVQNPTTQQVSELVDHAQFSMGFGLGFIVATGLASTVGLVTIGIAAFLMRSRRDDLLLRCWDQSRTVK